MVIHKRTMAFLKSGLTTLLFTFILTALDGQARPKIVVGITIDQMKQEYIHRFWDRYSEGGFKKLVREGHSYVDAHYSYKPTFTAPGHASIFTGTTPAVHGIIGNNWYDKKTKKSVYCTSDDEMSSVGTNSPAGKMSPRRMLASTISDEMRLFSNMRSKSLGISLKDRGAILPAGHAANAAYWFDGATGKWVTSTYYMEELPSWLVDFNARGLTREFLSKNWETLYPVDSYVNSLADNNPFEAIYKSEDTPTFPHDLLSILSREGFSLLAKTPFGNTSTKELAIAAIIGEELGVDDDTDMLSISFSSTDYIGHQFGPRSIELEDTYLRLDKDLEELINFLNEYLGEDSYLLFLTADHGAAETPLYLQNFEIPAGYFHIEGYKNGLKNYVDSIYGKGRWIENMSNDQLFINKEYIAEQGVNEEDIIEALMDYTLRFDGISNVVASTDLMHGNYENNRSLWMTQRGYHQKRSGDIHINMEPGWMIYQRKGTTHGSSYTYDTHVPIIMYGSTITPGKTYRRAHVIDIATTVSAILNVNLPNGASGTVLHEAILK